MKRKTIEFMIEKLINLTCFLEEKLNNGSKIRRSAILAEIDRTYRELIELTIKDLKDR